MTAEAIQINRDNTPTGAIRQICPDEMQGEAAMQDIQKEAAMQIHRGEPEEAATRVYPGKQKEAAMQIHRGEPEEAATQIQ